MRAERFFDELDQFTKRYVETVLGQDEHLSPWRSGGWNTPTKAPLGSIIHFTADERLDRVMAWFLVKRHNARVSAHAVVAPFWTAELRELAEGLTALEELAAPVFQVVRPWDEAWHATWTNDWAYGIENVNIGELQSRGGRFFSWRPRDRSAPEWTLPWDVHEGEPLPMWGRWWCAYTLEQVEANATLLIRLQELFGESLERGRILGHECVQANKRDPGPAFPVHAVRWALCDDDWQGMSGFDEDLMYGQNWRDAAAMEWYSITDPTAAMAMFQAEARERLAAGKKWSGTSLALRLLGYSTKLDGGGTETIQTFQRMMGLAADGIVGPVTRGALLQRLIDRGLIR